MARACVKNSCSLWDRLVPDLQEHIFGLAVEQHCRELMRTQICPGITLAAIKRNQASYVLVEEQIYRLREAGKRRFARGDAQQEHALREMMTKYDDKDGLQGASVDTVDAFLSSIASLPGHMRCLWMRHLGDVVDQQRLSSAALGRVTDPRRLKSVATCAAPCAQCEGGEGGVLVGHHR
jgi:hypothetical protein